MLLGAHLAGIAFSNAPVAGVHALAYPLGGLFHLPHGLTNALMLRPVLEHNAEAARELYAELAPMLHPRVEPLGSQAQAKGFIDRVCALAADTGLSLRLRDHGIGESDIPTLASEAMKQTRLLVNNPCPIDEADARRLYESAWCAARNLVTAPPTRVGGPSRRAGPTMTRTATSTMSCTMPGSTRR